ncbi:MAG TPA: response regulator [Ktedonobacteraceae bacterium]|nr:response regulator [Ktedonobacteraceae bacterium]
MKIAIGKSSIIIMACVGLLEDNPRLAKLCVTMLNLAGHEVIVYENAKECLNDLFEVATGYKSNNAQFFNEPKITLQPNLPVEVLILDLHLPDMNGIELLHYLQTHPNTSTLPLIFCTAATENEVSQALSIAPGAWVVWKPFKLQELLSAINEALQTS